MQLDQQARAAYKRLVNDLKEVTNQPVTGVSAAPLEKDFFEWHCNFAWCESPDDVEFDEWAAQTGKRLLTHRNDAHEAKRERLETHTNHRGKDTVFHLVLYFPKTYPAQSPSAEFLPEFQFSGGANIKGKKGGTNVCLSIFSDFAKYHPEWANEKGTGWSTAYTAQTVLLNLVAFLHGQSMDANARKAMAPSFKCECGHTGAKPWPPLPDAEKPAVSANGAAAKPAAPLDENFTCYITKSNLRDADKDEVFGFGLQRTGNPHNPQLTSPCEFMTLSGYKQLAAAGRVESVMREELLCFMPMFINPAHGAQIRQHFETACVSILQLNRAFQAPDAITVLTKLLNSSVVSFMNGSVHTSDRALLGYFFFHRLFIWALDQWPALKAEIAKRIDSFVADGNVRLKKNTPNVGDWLALLTVSEAHDFAKVAPVFLQENFERNVMWYLKEAPQLSDTKNNTQRAALTFKHTEVSRNLVAFQALFVDCARPTGMSLKAVAERYDVSNGQPSAAMQAQMKEAVRAIRACKNYGEWYKLLRLNAPSEDEMVKMLCASVEAASHKEGYSGGGGGGRGGRGGGGGGGRGGRGGRGRGGH